MSIESLINRHPYQAEAAAQPTRHLDPDRMVITVCLFASVVLPFLL